MDSLEALVVTLETAKKLKAAGFSQTTALAWEILAKGVSAIGVVGSNDFGSMGATDIAAPTAQELADQLHESISISIDSQRTCRVSSWSREFAEADTMAEALALLWLKLHEVSNG